MTCGCGGRENPMVTRGLALQQALAQYLHKIHLWARDVDFDENNAGSVLLKAPRLVKKITREVREDQWSDTVVDLTDIGDAHGYKVAPQDNGILFVPKRPHSGTFARDTIPDGVKRKSLPATREVTMSGRENPSKGKTMARRNPILEPDTAPARLQQKLAAIFDRYRVLGRQTRFDEPQKGVLRVRGSAATAVMNHVDAPLAREVSKTSWDSGFLMHEEWEDGELFFDPDPARRQNPSRGRTMARRKNPSSRTDIRRESLIKEIVAVLKKHKLFGMETTIETSTRGHVYLRGPTAERAIGSPRGKVLDELREAAYANEFGFEVGFGRDSGDEIIFEDDGSDRSREMDPPRERDMFSGGVGPAKTSRKANPKRRGNPTFRKTPKGRTVARTKKGKRRDVTSDTRKQASKFLNERRTAKKAGKRAKARKKFKNGNWMSDKAAALVLRWGAGPGRGGKARGGNGRSKAVTKSSAQPSGGKPLNAFAATVAPFMTK